MPRSNAPVDDREARCFTRNKNPRSAWVKLAAAAMSVIFLALVAVVALGFKSYSDQKHGSTSESQEGGNSTGLPPTMVPPQTDEPTPPPSSSPPTPAPSPQQTTIPTLLPSESIPQETSIPTMEPSAATSSIPTMEPSAAITDLPTIAPTGSPTASNITKTVFYAIADVPYTNSEAIALRKEVPSIPIDGEFLIHLGDIKKKYQRCTNESMQEVADILLLSPVPVFIVVGDNEYNDCSNPNTALMQWREVFHEFDKRWEHSLKVTRQVNYPENFSFVHKSTLFIGLNIVGGQVHDSSEWKERLDGEVNWTIDLIETHTSGDFPAANGVVIFGHANPADKHKRFFNPLKSYISNVMQNRIPVLYMGGDVHQWLYEPNFFSQSNFLRIRLSGGMTDQPLKMIVDPTEFSTAAESFQFEREWDA